MPGLMGYNAYYDWNVTTNDQTYINNKIVGIPQGRVIGGGTTINGMVWTRGSAADYDAWEQLGNPGWGWKDLLPYFKKVPARGNARRSRTREKDADASCTERDLHRQRRRRAEHAAAHPVRWHSSWDLGAC